MARRAGAAGRAEEERSVVWGSFAGQQAGPHTFAELGNYWFRGLGRLGPGFSLLLLASRTAVIGGSGPSGRRSLIFPGVSRTQYESSIQHLLNGALEKNSPE